MLVVVCCPALQAQSDSPAPVAVWVTRAGSVEGSGALEEYLLDRLGSNGAFMVCDPHRVRAAGVFFGLNQALVFDPQKLSALGQAVDVRWVVWVKVTDRAVEFKKGLSIPHLFIRRKAVSRMLVDARVVDARTGKTVASNRWRLDHSGAGSYQVAEDVPQDPVYNNSVGQFARYERALEWDAARSISIWFKSLIPNVPDPPPSSNTGEATFDRGPFGAQDEPSRK